MSEEIKENGHQPHRYDYGGNPLAREDTSDSARAQAFGGALQPGLFKAASSKGLANPAPLGLCAFALTTFLLSLINMGTLGTSAPNIVIASAFGYGGVVQLLAGMWEMAAGNTFGATALSSYGGFWISFGLIFTQGPPKVEGYYLDSGIPGEFYNVFSFWLFGWFIFTTLLVLCTLRSTVAFFFLFFTLDLAFLMLGLAYLYPVTANGAPVSANKGLNIAGGVFGILASFAAWYNALAGILDRTNSFFLVPVVHFPWSEKGRERKGLPKFADTKSSEAV